MKFAKELQELNLKECRADEPLARHTTWKIGGPADMFVAPRETVQLEEILDIAGRLPFYFLGGGSNLLVSDRGVRGVVLRLRGDFERIVVRPPLIECGAGANLHKVLMKGAEAGVGGLEFLCGIPGAVGGAVMNNSGTKTDWILHRIVEIGALRLSSRKRVVLHPDELDYSYRWSGLRKRGLVLTDCVLKGEEAPVTTIRENLEKLTNYRIKTQPYGVPSAGSVFKNPEGNFAGRLLEEVGMKGRIIGKAQVSEKHANFIINLGGASGHDVATLISTGRQRVFEETGIVLKTEIEFTGEWDESSAEGALTHGSVAGHGPRHLRRPVCAHGHAAVQCAGSHRLRR
ncbi:MAG: UDP-N-acetylmuramate dehydrogenase [bacterium]